MVKRVVVGSHYGIRDWLAQRATAVIMALYTVIFLGAIVCVRPDSFEAWHRLFSGGFMQFTTFLFFISMFWHAGIGVRDIWMDYVKPVGVRLVLHVVTATILVGYAGWAIRILWGV